jgi:hypothetical protein
MTEVIVAGFDREECKRLARRLRAIAQHAALPMVIRVTGDAIEVQRLGKSGACTLIVDGHKVAQGPFPGDDELEKLLVASVTADTADTFAVTA